VLILSEILIKDDASCWLFLALTFQKDTLGK